MNNPVDLYIENVRLALGGDHEAFNTLVKLATNAVNATIYSKLSSKDVSYGQDIFQLSFIKAYEKLDTLKDPGKFQAWICTIARNECIDHFRKNMEINFSDISDDSNFIDDVLLADEIDYNTPSEIASRDEVSEIVNDILSTLPTNQRICISGSFIDQLSHSEIAEELGVSVNTVKSRIRDGKLEVERIVEEYQKRGYKIYGLTPFAFYIYFVSQPELYVAPIQPIVPQATSSIINKLMNNSTLVKTVGVVVTSGALAIAGTTYLGRDKTPAPIVPEEENVPVIEEPVVDNTLSYSVDYSDIKQSELYFVNEDTGVIYLNTNEGSEVISSDGNDRLKFEDKISNIIPSTTEICQYNSNINCDGIDALVNLAFEKPDGTTYARFVGGKNSGLNLSDLGEGNPGGSGVPYGNFDIVVYNRELNKLQQIYFNGDYYLYSQPTISEVMYYEGVVYELASSIIEETKVILNFTGKVGLYSYEQEETWNPDTMLVFDAINERGSVGGRVDFKVAVKNGKVGLIDSESNTLVDFQYDLPNNLALEQAQIYDSGENSGSTVNEDVEGVSYQINGLTSFFPQKRSHLAENSAYFYANVNQETYNYTTVGLDGKTIIIDIDNNRSESSWDEVMSLTDDSFLVRNGDVWSKITMDTSKLRDTSLFPTLKPKESGKFKYITMKVNDESGNQSDYIVPTDEYSTITNENSPVSVELEITDGVIDSFRFERTYEFASSYDDMDEEYRSDVIEREYNKEANYAARDNRIGVDGGAYSLDPNKEFIVVYNSMDYRDLTYGEYMNMNTLPILAENHIQYENGKIGTKSYRRSIDYFFGNQSSIEDASNYEDFIKNPGKYFEVTKSAGGSA